MFTLPPWRAVAPIVLALASPIAALAQPDRVLDTPTGWEYYFGASSATQDARLAAGFRPFFMERVGSDAYDAILVQNTGVYAVSGTDLTYGASPSSFSLTMSLSNRRPLELEAVGSSSGTHLVYAITVPNSGSTAAPGHAYTITQASVNDLVNWANTQGVRPIDIDKNPQTGLYSAAGVPNTGSNAQSWWWYFGVTEAQVVTFLTQNGARLIDVIVENGGTTGNPTPTFSVVMVGQNPGAGVIDLSATSADISNIVNYNKMRLTIMERYTNSTGATRWAVAAVDNAFPEERRIRDLLNSEMDGVKGFARRRVGGSYELTMNENFAFEPASSMKIVHAAYTMARIQADAYSLASQVYLQSRCTQDPYPDQCPDQVGTCNAGNLDLGETLRRMMQRSDNHATKTIELLHTRTTLNNWMAGLGFTTHHINHTLGCLCGETRNSMSARHFCDFYDMIDRAVLFDTGHREALYDRMYRYDGQTNYESAGGYINLNAIITQEAAATDLTAGEVQDFRDHFDMVLKAGGYGCGPPNEFHRGYAGWAGVPSRGAVNGVPIYGATDHTVAMFVNDSTDSNDSYEVYRLTFELLREPIRDALESWDAGCSPPQPIASTSYTATEGDDVTIPVVPGGTNLSRTYQWQFRPSLFNPWANLANAAGQASGATTATLSL
jgi:hypothetical protein